jgi:hypothetical protein
MTHDKIEPVVKEIRNRSMEGLLTLDPPFPKENFTPIV